MTEADDIREAGVEASEEIRSATDEGVRLAAQERERLTVQVQDDRLADAPPERQLTTQQVQRDRREDEVDNRGHIQQDRRDDEQGNRDSIQQDRRDDQEPERERTASRIQADRRRDDEPRSALEVVRADKLLRALTLLESVRKMCLGLLVVVVILAFILADQRARLDANRDATADVARAFDDFNDTNSAVISHHERTQRLICRWYRANGMSPPDNGDCDNR